MIQVDNLLRRYGSFVGGAFPALTLFVFFWVEAFFARNIADMRPLYLPSFRADPLIEESARDKLVNTAGDRRMRKKPRLTR